MRLVEKTFFICIAISQIVFMIVCIETQANIRLVKRVTVVPGGGPKDLTNVNGTLFFTADDGMHGRELWKSDGTSVGTVMAKDIDTFPGASSNPGDFTNVNSTFYFVANKYELWKIFENEESFPWELFVPAFIKKTQAVKNKREEVIQ